MRPPPPRGLPRWLPRRVRARFTLLAAALSAVAALLAPMCPLADRAGRPLWRVQTVHDGDTVTCLDDRGQAVKIRLVGIDAPEYDQPHGAAARAALAAKVGGAVRVEGRGRDQHGRVLATLWNGDRDVNHEMVADGWAWEFGGFVSDDDLAAAEEAARRSRRGLWADPQAMRPSEWRALHPPRHSR